MNLALAVSGRRKLPRRRARLPRQRQPNAERLAYRGALQGVLGELQRAIRAELFPELLSIIHEAAVRRDAIAPKSYADRVVEILEGVSRRFFETFTNERLRALAETYARRVSTAQRVELARQFKAALHVDVFAAEPWLEKRLAAFASENAQLVGKASRQLVDEVSSTTLQAVRTGKGAAEVEQLLVDRFGVSDSRAELIARDQVGKLHAGLNEERQRELGVEGYVWRTSADERVRPEHAAREGKRFRWSDPPADGHPGQPYNCRCEAAPDLEALMERLT